MTEEIATYHEKRKPLDGWTRSPVVAIAVLLGIVMPIISAMIYPTYRHKMPDPWVEATRLLELPFVAVEVAISVFAMLRGISIVDMWDL